MKVCETERLLLCLLFSLLNISIHAQDADSKKIHEQDSIATRSFIYNLDKMANEALNQEAFIADNSENAREIIRSNFFSGCQVSTRSKQTLHCGENLRKH